MNRRNAMAVLAHVAGTLAAGGLTAASVATPATAADPAVIYMDRVAKDMMAAARSRSPQVMQATVGRHADTQGLGLYALGDYRPRLEPGDQQAYLTGMIKFIGRYAANEAPKYPVAGVKFSPEVRRAKYGMMVDSTITLQDGSNYEISWLVVKYGTSFRVRDAQAMGIWLSPLLKKLFEDYIAQNGGSVKALVQVLQRH